MERLKSIKKDKSVVKWRHNSSASLPVNAATTATTTDSTSSSTTTTASASAAPTATAAAATTTSDDGTAKMPPGWTRKESKTQKGRYYYISPAGKTQWTPPIVQPAVAPDEPIVLPTFNWVNEVEIEFGDGRLGVSLREVRIYETTPYPLFQAEVDDLPKINGKAGPAELYNWSVKPHKRLTIGMRVTGIEDLNLVGLPYKDVVDRLKKAPRPLRIRFADVEQGTVEENPTLAAQRRTLLEASTTSFSSSFVASDATSTSSSAYEQQKVAFTRVLVTRELHLELWTIESKKLLRQLRLTQFKWDAVSSEFDLLNQQRVAWTRENERLVREKQQYDKMLRHLKLQANHAMENPELVTANALAKRNANLTEDIAKMSAGNKRLRKERGTIQTALDDVEQALAALQVSTTAAATDETNDDSDEFFGVDLTTTTSDQLAAFKKKIRFMEDELSKEQRKATKVQREMEQLQRHLASLTKGTSSSVHATKARADDKDALSSKDAGAHTTKSSTPATSPAIAHLEFKISELRKQQRSVVDTMSKAAQVGDQDLAKECQRRRHAIKDELKHAQDELRALQTPAPATDDPAAAGSHPSAAATATGASSTTTTRSRKPSTSPSINNRSSNESPSLTRQPSEESSSSSFSTSGGANASSRSKKPTGDKQLPTLCGFLDKGPTEWSERGLTGKMKSMRGARERWCEIAIDGRLKYYKRRGDPVVRGEIDLADPSLEVVCEDTKRGREFVLSTSEQQSHFFTKSTPELDKWVKTLRAAHVYLKNARALDAATKKHADAVELQQRKQQHYASARSATASASSASGMSRAAQQAIDEDNYPEEDEQFYGRATLGF